MKRFMIIPLALALLLMMAFTSTALAATQQGSCNGATIVLTPATGPAGGSISVSGSGIATWAPTYELHWDSPTGTLLASGTADGLGLYSTSFNIPMGAALGDHLVYLVATAPNESAIECPATLVVVAAEANLGVQPDAYAQARASLPSTGIFLLPAAGLLAAGAGLIIRRRHS